MRRVFMVLVWTVVVLPFLVACTTGAPPEPTTSAPPEVLPDRKPVEPTKSDVSGPFTDLLGMTPEQVEDRLGVPEQITALDKNWVRWRYEDILVGVYLVNGKKVIIVTQESGWITPTLRIGDDEEKVRREIGPPRSRLTPNGREMVAIREDTTYAVEVVISNGKAVRAIIRVAGGDD